MRSHVFNPFGVFDRTWAQKFLPYVLVTVLGVLLLASILGTLFPSFHESLKARNVYTMGMLAALLTAAPLVFYWLSRLGSVSAGLPIRLRDTEEEAIRAILTDGPARNLGAVDISCYTGPTFLSVLSNISPPPGAFSGARVLIRHPNAGFRIPSDPARARSMRERIVANVHLFKQILEPASGRFEIRGYSCEPSLRGMLVGESHGFFTLYTTGERIFEGRRTRDYVSRGKPVFEFTTGNAVGDTMTATFKARFDDMWSMSCRIFPKPILIFDFDGTLYHSIEFHKEAWRTVLSEEGIGIEDPRFETVIQGVKKGYPAPVVLEKVRIKGVSRDNLVGRKRAVYEKIIADAKCELDDETATCIFELHRRGYQLAIASIAARSVVEKVLEEAGARDCFSAIVCREDVARSKPEPDVILRVCDIMKIDPCDAVMIGDTVADQMAAASAGMCFVSLAAGGEYQGPDAVRTTRAFESLGSIREALDLFLPI